MEQTEQSRLLLSFIHSIFCKKKHPDECDFYTVIEMADCWEHPDVVCWTFLTQLIMKKMRTNEKGLLDSLSKVYNQLEGLNRLTEAEKKLFKAILNESDLSFLTLVEPASAEVPPLIDSSSGMSEILEVCLPHDD